MMKLQTKILLTLAALAALAVVAGSAYGAEYFLRADVTNKVMPGTGEVVTMWGFARDSVFNGLDGIVNVPGPTLTVAPGDDTLTIHLDNNLPVPVSIVIPGQIANASNALSPVWSGGRVMSFTTETAPGNTSAQDYVWGSLRPGTYLYMSGTNPAIQVQMGLYGPVKKDDSAGQAYADAATAYDREVILLFSEVDPVIHNAVATGNYGPGLEVQSSVDYLPKYFMINGAAFSGASTPIPANSGEDVLLRFLNAGLRTHVPVIDGGLYMTLLAEDGNVLPFKPSQYSLILPAGKTKDVMISPTAAGSYALYDRRLDLTNSALADGGMLAFFNVARLTKYSLRVNMAGNGSGLVTAQGINCGSVCSGQYDPGTAVSLRAAASRGSVFKGWSGACSGRTLCTVSMSAAQSVTATFEGTLSIAGVIRASRGTPVEGITITLSGPVSQTTVTDSRGRFSFKGLPPGSYIVTPAKEGYTFTPQSKSVTLTNTGVPGVKFTAVR